jgi:ammonium transporter
MPQIPIEILWLGICTGLVFLMQAGFLCLESGLTRSKNNINVAVKNLADLGISLLLFWAVGYGLMFGVSFRGILGISNFGPNLQAAGGGETVYALYQAMFCGTAVTILSGAIAERIRFQTYLLIAAVTSGIVYPVFGHWVWATGWLKTIGFFDYAGSTVVHSLGGWVALALLLIVGPRTGRFSDTGEVNPIRGSNLPTAALGTLILWFGWFGFNGGGTLSFTTHLPNVLMNTMLAGASGLMVCLLIGKIRPSGREVEMLMNGSLAGLVAITANPIAISTGGAILVGAIGAVVMVLADGILLRFRIDDAVGAIPVHLAAGIWGTLAVPLLGDHVGLGMTSGTLHHLSIQAAGVLSCGAWAFGSTYVLFRLVGARFSLRVTAEDERQGLNISEHGASSEMLDLFNAMDHASQTGDLTARAPEDPFTEVGQIASRYNQVMDSLEREVARTEAVVGSAMDGIVTFGRETLAIQSLNPAASEMFGVSLEEMRNQPVTQLIVSEGEGLSSDDPDQVRRVFEEMERLGDPVRTLGQRSDGSRFTMEIQVTEARAGEESFFVATFRDVSDRDRIEEQIRDLARFPDENPNPVFRVAADGQVLYANQHGNTLMQAWLGDIGHPLVDTLKPVLDDAMSTDRVCEVEERCADKVFLFAMAPVAEANYINVYCRDITESKRQEEQIRDLARFPDENPNPVLRIGADGKVLYSNNHANELMDKWREDVGETLVTTLARTIEKAIDTGEVAERECECGDRVFAFAAAPVVDETYVNVYTRDVTDTRLAEDALRASEAQTRMIIDTALDALVTMDADGIIRAWNPQAVAIFGWEVDEAIGQELSDLIVPEGYRDAHRKGLAHFLETGEGPVLNQRIEIEGMHKSGRVFPIELSISPVEVGNGYTFSAFVRDITERNENDAALRQARDAAETANRAKSAFLANMSHELRTPLNAILGFSQLMMRDKGLTADQVENLEVIGRSGEHLLSLINDVLEMSKIEAGQSNLNAITFDLHQMIQTMEEMFDLRASDKGLQLLFEFSPDVPRFIEADEGKLRQILINLISNAVKFTDEGGVSLRAATTPYFEEDQTDDDQQFLWVKFEIEDTGAGISDDEIETLFDAFVQTESGTKSQEGTGLGLPISRQFVQLMGGDIEVSSQEDKGSIFRFQVRAKLSDEALASVETHRRRVVGIAEGRSDLRILIVEDKPENSKLLSKLLNQVGFETKIAVNGKEGVEVWESWEPHLVWMDMRMPVMDGYEATKRIKATVKGQATVVVALTASAFEEQQSFILSAGCDDFVRKPFREAEIFDTMHRHLGVEFIYDDEDTPDEEPDAAASDASSKASLAVLEQSWKSRLRDAAEQADSDAIERLVEEIVDDYPGLAGTLSRISGDFNFHLILAMLDGE